MKIQFSTYYTDAPAGQVLRNVDLALPKFFARVDGQILDIKNAWEISDSRISRAVYFHAASAPYINYYDYSLGSVYDGYVVPTSYYEFEVGSGKVQVRPAFQKSLSLDDYTKLLSSRIKHHIDDVFSRYSTVNVCYSGGIDSTVLLSFIWNLGYFNRTKIVVMENHSQPYSGALVNHKQRYQTVKEFIDKFRDSYHSSQIIAFGDEKIADAFNQGTFREYNSYTTRGILSYFKNEAIMMGHNGNQSLLHKDAMADEIMLQRPDQCYTREQWKEKFDHDGTYSTYLRKWDPENPHKISLDDHSLILKPWKVNDGFQGNELITPLALDHDLIRQLDFKTVSIDDIASVSVGRRMLRENVGDLFDPYLSNEGQNDIGMPQIEIDARLIDPAKLKIDMSLEHDPEGIDFINYELARSQSSGTLHTNTLMTIKMLEWLSTIKSNNIDHGN